MSPQRRTAPSAKAAPSKMSAESSGSPYGYAFTDWLAKEDPEFMRARAPLSTLSFGEGKELSIK